MSENQNPNRNIVPRSAGFFQDLTNRFRLISRLIMDSRVNPFIKVLPIATLAYVIWPVDLLPVNPIDDAFVIWIGTSLFVELCPPNVVDEHMRDLNHRNIAGGAQEGEIVDGEYYEGDPTNPRRTSSR